VRCHTGESLCSLLVAVLAYNFLYFFCNNFLLHSFLEVSCQSKSIKASVLRRADNQCCFGTQVVGDVEKTCFLIFFLRFFLTYLSSEQVSDLRLFLRHILIPDDLSSALHYIHHNPVASRLSYSASEYPWSSASEEWDVTSLPLSLSLTSAGRRPTLINDVS
jgi:hypothetical protein